ncbi:MAG TPA: bifunctional (p)ppGpp synthetase/guanosine-3',5'-bis(diphosphate) 3'-pyrophosphohydrolase [bacterium]|nr:bifunctional (p)ppGpp synthetase/guanosine-3',5'-bis(diphosphate) 3'-pyrophosphohydrolase [bacterium]HQL62838.1 bifunctional (p)ppGpp synthetase/guanosine-3',5'-bis(diphosphate) 3'-pyrophosphohydrolase [bacterium]
MGRLIHRLPNRVAGGSSNGATNRHCQRSDNHCPSWFRNRLLDRARAIERQGRLLQRRFPSISRPSYSEHPHRIAYPGTWAGRSTSRIISVRKALISRENLAVLNTFRRFRDVAGSYLENRDLQLCELALGFAHEAHEGSFRKSGEPYILHPVAVATTLAENRMDPETVAAGLLHDVLEDTKYSAEDLTALFGETITMLVEGVTKVDEVRNICRAEKETEYLRHMLVTTAKDLRVIIIKLCDRLHNMQTLQYLPPSDRTRIAQDTMDIFAPLAHRLGLGRIKWQLEDLAFQYLEPLQYSRLKELVSQKRADREAYVEAVRRELAGILEDRKIEAKVEGRAKHFFSIYEKMRRDLTGLEGIYDLYALRVICRTVEDCYHILGIVHTRWPQVEGRFKDYISRPKENNYRSLHTTVIGPKGRMVEIQIRTESMHLVAEWGVAAHWHYKEKGPQRRLGRAAKWIVNLSRDVSPDEDPEQFLKSFQEQLSTKEVLVLTPKGNIRRLPKGATPIDFAYKIHTDLGNRCAGAKVNGVMAKLDQELKTGDYVEIITKADARPSPKWLKIAKTQQAKSKIMRYLAKYDRDEWITQGRHILDPELRHLGLNPNEFYKSDRCKAIVKDLQRKNADDLLVNIGLGRTDLKRVVARLIPTASKTEKTVTLPTQTGAGIRIGEIDNLVYRRAGCCSPVPGDDILGFVTRGRGITIHRKNCRNRYQFEREPDRVIDLFWEGGDRASVRADLELEAHDRRGIISDVTQCISSHSTTIASMNTQTRGGLTHFDVTVGVKDLNQLNRLMHTLLGVKGVIIVHRKRDVGNGTAPVKH